MHGLLHSGAEIITFGYRLNSSGSEIIRGYTRALCNTVMVLTHTVTASAGQSARPAIHRVRRERPGADIVVIGGAPALQSARWAALPNRTRTQDNTEQPRPESRNVGGARHSLQGIEARAHASAQAQQGSNQCSTYGIIPIARGLSRRIAFGMQVTQILQLTSAGVQVIVLTGVDIGSYGPDLPGAPSFGETVRRRLGLIPELPRLGLFWLDSASMNPVLALIARARAVRPGPGIGADLIAAFQSKTVAFCQETSGFRHETALPYRYSFPYFECLAPPYAGMPAVPLPERRARAARVRVTRRPAAQLGAAATQHVAAFRQAQVGRDVPIVVERGGARRTAC